MNKRKETIIKHLKMMGYGVSDHPIDSHMFRVTFRTNKGYTVTTIVTDEDLMQDFIVEYIVARINDFIVREL